ncbi:hypothetical protein APASM_6046 [Actinosynnema pretiosum subsp. pretiosum]|nr:hypothetical protein APASM_6046 [Actinosynnema pretiosum subsp. pretiosum]
MTCRNHRNPLTSPRCADDVGIVPAQDQLTTALGDARAALQKAVETYEANDSQTKKTLDEQ